MPLVDFIHDGHHQPRYFGDVGRLQVSDLASPCNVYINLNDGNVRIDDYAIFGHDVMLLTGAHDYRKADKERRDSGAHNPDWPWPNGADIWIKHGAWICSRAIIIGPCVIGENAVVAAGAVVTSDVEPWCVVAGNPAKVIRWIEH